MNNFIYENIFILISYIALLFNDKYPNVLSFTISKNRHINVGVTGSLYTLYKKTTILGMKHNNNINKQKYNPNV